MNEGNGLVLLGAGYAAPSRVVTNDDLSARVDTSDEWIRSRTGIARRRFLGDGETLTQLACTAARRAIEDSGISPDELACVLCATISYERATPSLACAVQAELGLPEDIFAADVNAACSGFLYALEMARGLMLGGKKRRALVIGCEAMSRLLDMDDRSTCVLFGDGAGAAVVAVDGNAAHAGVFGVRGSNILRAGHDGGERLHMDGAAVYRFAVETVPKALEALFAKAGVTLDELDFVVCHQANERIIDACAKKLGAPAEKFYRNIASWGNTGAASIPIALAEMKETGLLRPGARVALAGFGAGLAWAAMTLTVRGGTR